MTDAEIAALIEETKTLPADYLQRLKQKTKRGHREAEVELPGTRGSVFRVIIRESSENPLDFSVILAHKPPNTNVWFRLRRYNGKSHEHTNRLEGSKFFDFHIHTATERYQDSGFREDAFAEPTARYSDVNGALECLISDCGFEIERGNQKSLFEEGKDQ
ncbi:MAG: hypothetical protein DYH07_07025 [Armatimonadetes bacterium ATM1]|nr:MAG: hypothetical protein EDM74_11115 [Armatimonadota bacterium]MBC6970426.1 hypothetical protein [Armatimonadota bacterium]MCE7899831.1 hypothetical protein [Armatimonadetes bacterium ATM1]RIJ94055.1 MAG: hypothetical protein DCC45_13105 [Armatimonadota bacterium]